ncbi:hypothetical protein [Dyadobacter sp. NIV53]|uniref:hypothetical protein n=1 Tax=Dyadobacter sp. NIV53 TaxID=2861765 RepID=UPI001C870EEE|nr:hypothetical protein [Dyadobacter sp. NIV53]
MQTKAENTKSIKSKGIKNENEILQDQEGVKLNDLNGLINDAVDTKEENKAKEEREKN